MDPIASVGSVITTVSAEYNLSAPIRDSFVAARQVGPLPSDYFFLTDLVVPTQAYWRRKAPHVRRSQALANRLELGRQRHRIAGYWFGSLPGFQLSETNLNGHYVGVPGVVGRFDFLLDDKILEFKTKTAQDIDLPEVSGKYLQDLEQLAFYSALSVDAPENNILCFLGSGSPYAANVRAFDVRVLHHEQVRQILRDRIDWLKARLAASDPSGLPRCPYYSDLCEFESTACSCQSAPTSWIGNVLDHVRISRNQTIEAALSAARSPAPPSNGVWTIRDLMFPRQRYHTAWEYEPSDAYVPYVSAPEKDAAVALLSSCIWRQGVQPGRSERDRIHSGGDSQVLCARSYINANVPGSGPGESTIPLLVRGSSARRTLSRPTDYHLAELALTCGRLGLSAGVVALAFYNEDLPPMLYLVRFDSARLKRFYQTSKSQISTAIESGDPSPLPRCTFMESCPFAGCACKQELSAASRSGSSP